MNCSVNLVPVDCLHARARRKRRNSWAAAIVGTAAFILTVWLVSGTASHAVERAGKRLAETQARQLALQRELTTANAARARLVDQLRLLCGLRQSQPWAGRLAGLARGVPPGIVLTEVTVDSQDPRLRGRAARLPSGPHAAPDSRGRAAVPPPIAQGRPPGSAGLAAQLSGLAITHDELTRLIEFLQRGDSWQRVELTRAGRQPFLESFAVAFEIRCWPEAPAEPRGTGGAR